MNSKDKYSKANAVKLKTIKLAYKQLLSQAHKSYLQIEYEQ